MNTGGSENFSDNQDFKLSMTNHIWRQRNPITYRSVNANALNCSSESPVPPSICQSPMSLRNSVMTNKNMSSTGKKPVATNLRTRNFNIDINQYREMNAKKLISKHRNNKEEKNDMSPASRGPTSRLGAYSKDYKEHFREMLRNIKSNQKEEKVDEPRDSTSTLEGRRRKNRMELLAEQLKLQR